MAETTRTYRDTLRRYYEEEIEGEAWFAALARRLDDPHARNCLNLLAQVERHAAEAVEPLLARHGIVPGDRGALVASGTAQAESSPGDWTALRAEMRRTFPGYVDDFRKLEAMGPPEDRALLEFLTEHEVAAVEFLALEASGAAETTDPLLRYLRAKPTEGTG